MVSLFLIGYSDCDLFCYAFIVHLAMLAKGCGMDRLGRYQLLEVLNIYLSYIDYPQRSMAGILHHTSSQYQTTVSYRILHRVVHTDLGCETCEALPLA